MFYEWPHPIAGIAAAFAGVSGGFSANLLPGQLDALLFGITEAAVLTIFGGFSANIAGNWFFIAAMTVIFVPVIWFITDRMIEPRLETFDPAGHRRYQRDPKAADGIERKGLINAGWATLFVIGLGSTSPGTPLVNELPPRRS